jgi:hypothetical protein
MFKYSFELFFSFKFCKTYQDMFNKEFNVQNIFKQESSKIANTYFLPSKNQARMSVIFFKPSKSQARLQLLEKVQSRSRQEFDKKKLEIKNFKQVLLFSVCVLTTSRPTTAS